ncbi:aquaporin-like protein [Aureobasidium sp. EXF-10727]|nr:aquaporin-like protein [Aureobasidium sp. EXF-10727]KAI4731207.1 aquaporin-like protein [Aureobasidium sp. EXF-10728]
MAVRIPAYLHRSGLRPYLAEFIGTLLLILIGDGVVAQAVLTDFYYADYLSVNLAWAAAVALSCYIGAAVNPAITLASAITRPTKLQWTQLPGKIVAQFAGAFVGAALVYLQYRSAIKVWDPEFTVPGGSILSTQGHSSAGIFATYPSTTLESNWEAAVTEFLGSSLLAFGAFAVADKKNEGLKAPQFMMFALMVAIGASMGWQTGYAVNPARDFGPRVFSAIVYGREVFSAKGFYFVVPLFVPVFGCIAGAAVYDAFMFEGEGSAVTDALDAAEGNDGRIALE